MPAPAYAPLDDALEILAPFGTELTNGNFNRVNLAVLHRKARHSASRVYN
jgi:hypothetical protein